MRTFAHRILFTLGIKRPMSTDWMGIGFGHIMGQDDRVLHGATGSAVLLDLYGIHMLSCSIISESSFTVTCDPVASRIDSNQLEP